jgi:putative ABC transport system substrate-binding protein
MIPAGSDQLVIDIGRRQFLSALGGAAATWSLTASAQQSALPVVGVINGGSADALARYVAAFRKGLNETGFVEGQNVTVEYHWLEGQYDRLPALSATSRRTRRRRSNEHRASAGRPGALADLLNAQF